MTIAAFSFCASAPIWSRISSKRLFLLGGDQYDLAANASCPVGVVVLVDSM